MPAGRSVRAVPAVSQTAVGFPGLVRRHRAAADLTRSAACALGFGSIVLVGLGDGGYYASTWRWAGLALAATVGIQLLSRREVGLSRLALVSFVSLASLGAWMLLSSLWGIEGTEALREAERCALYAAALGAFLVVARPSTTRALLTGVLCGAVLLAIVGLASRFFSPQALDPYQGSLLKEPVGYANALGILMALGVVLGLGLLFDARRTSLQVALAAATCTSAVALALTSSRGAWLATLVGLGVLVAFRFGSTRVVLAIAAGAVVLVLLALPRVSLGDRPAYWGVAVTDASERTLLGSGAGSFDDYWLEHRPIPAYVRDAHSVYLETAAELGVVGLTLLLCALGMPLVTAARARDRRFVAPAAAAYSTFLVHAGLDWDWEMPVTTLAGLACGAALLASGRGLSRS
jgi:O-antigen ligase